MTKASNITKPTMTQPSNPQEEIIEGWRADPHGKYTKKGGKNGLEPTSMKFNVAKLRSFLKAYSVGIKYGMPQLQPKDLYALLMKEGTENFGANQYDKNDKKSGDIWLKVRQELIKDGEDPLEAEEHAIFPAAIYDHAKRSKSKGITFGHSYSGTGYAARTQKTGEQEGQMMLDQYSGYDKSENKNLIDFITHWGGFKAAPNAQEKPPTANKQSSLDQVMPEIDKTLNDLSAVREKEQINVPQISGVPV